MKSPLKWVGGKKKLVPLLLSHAPKSFKTYWEPFLGGGSLLFSLAPEGEVFCSDLNEDLILMYRALKHDAKSVGDLLDTYPNTSDFYYNMRAKTEGLTLVESAARFLYLNHAGFNGLYRVNKTGKFNVAYGKRKTLSYSRENILEVGKYLREADVCLTSEKYENMVNKVNTDDFVYLDPPYYETFDGYTSQQFGLEELKTLKSNVDDMVANGARVLISNSNHDTVREMFSNYTIFTVNVAWTVGKNGDTRAKKENEILIKTW